MDQPRTLAVAERAVVGQGLGQGIRVVRKLPGGTHASTWLVEIMNEGTEAVLREFPAGDSSVASEARVLRTLDGLSGLAPRLLSCGVTDNATPWLLLSRLPGTADITTEDSTVVAKALRVALARVHAEPLNQLRAFVWSTKWTADASPIWPVPPRPLLNHTGKLSLKGRLF